jgi:hypothetical protein
MRGLASRIIRSQRYPRIHAGRAASRDNDLAGAPGGGAPQVWFQNAAINGPSGPNGVRVDKKSEKLHLT